jgi:hypothetical protein
LRGWRWSWRGQNLWSAERAAEDVIGEFVVAEGIDLVVMAPPRGPVSRIVSWATPPSACCNAHLCSVLAVKPDGIDPAARVNNEI